MQTHIQLSYMQCLVCCTFTVEGWGVETPSSTWAILLMISSVISCLSSSTCSPIRGMELSITYRDRYKKKQTPGQLITWMNVCHYWIRTSSTRWHCCISYGEDCQIVFSLRMMSVIMDLVGLCQQWWVIFTEITYPPMLLTVWAISYTTLDTLRMTLTSWAEPTHSHTPQKVPSPGSVQLHPPVNGAATTTAEELTGC